MKRVIVIGLGIFGINLVKTLYENGIEIIAIDKNKDVVQQVKESCSKAILADGTNKEVIDSIGIQEDDIVIISFGEDLSASTLITLHLRELKVKHIIVKAPNEDHKRVLEKVGATDIIIPEKEIADKVARSIISPNVLDYIPLSEDSFLLPAFMGRRLGSSV
jgi:trk system potassium uptake protein TrkA